jgi:gamma-glutamylcyclotransferase (GGCT)/AIG2-like uncharacterized protein YtfP
MRLFLYGTLMDPTTLAQRSGDPGLPRTRQRAWITGWQRVALPGVPWPTLRRGHGGMVSGVTVTVGASALRRLSAYEGPAYRLRRVVVATLTGKTAAWTWIAPGGTTRRWKG